MAWIRITLFSVLSVTANIVFLISCASTSLKDICLWRVNVERLAESLKDAAAADSGVEVAKPLIPPALPTYWYYGIDGICDVFETSTGDDEVYCRRGFLPSHNVLDVLDDSLRYNIRRQSQSQSQSRHDQGEQEEDEEATTVMASWKTALTNLNPSRTLIAKESTVNTLMRTSAGLVVASILFHFFSVALALTSPSGSNAAAAAGAGWMFALASLVAMAGGICATQAMRLGAHGASGTGENAGPAVIIVLVGAAMSTVASWSLLCFPGQKKRRRDDEEEEERAEEEEEEDEELAKKEIGYRGGKFVYEWLGRSGLSNWSSENWTSGLRSRAGYGEYPRWEEKRHSGFTYDDLNGELGALLQSLGVPVPSGTTSYHLEIKSTLDQGCDGRNMIVSENQRELMETYRPGTGHVYILVRVFNLMERPSLRFFVDPVDHADLNWGPLNNGEYRVMSSNTNQFNTVIPY
ncbi:hypothetical protein VTJ49DRAFT_3331 [Mycothermus thermophilus]|uniref:Uncharacterized protein n=1 Tax=Humicola insolens TaxID=85995 RepID=A0ABR3VN02_HUMIN